MTSTLHLMMTAIQFYISSSYIIRTCTWHVYNKNYFIMNNKMFQQEQLHK